MKLRMVGCSHHASDLALRQQLAFDNDQICRALGKWRSDLPNTELTLLSTCNRVELYAAGGDESPEAEVLVAALAGFHKILPEKINDRLVTLSDQEVVEHLFRVAASLDSMVVGEPQILSQVKQAYQLAQQHAAAGPRLHDLFQAALRTAKRVASETSLHRFRVSVPSVAIAELATCVFESFDDKHVLVAGAGEMAEETLRYLCETGKPRIRVVNRNAERGEKLAHGWNGTFHPWEQLCDQLVWADLAISTTAATEPIVTAALFAEKVAPRRHQQPLVILDLAVPQDIDPAINDELGVYLFSIDDLKAACDKNRAARAAELPNAESIVAEEALKFVAETHRRSTAPIITELREGWHRPKDAELERLFGKLPELDEKSKEEIRQFADRLVNKLLHPPLESLRDASENGTHHMLLDAIRRIFKLEQ